LSVAAALTVAVATTQSVASAARPRTVEVSVAASDQAVAVHIAAAPVSRCTLKVSARHRSTIFAPIAVGKYGRATIKWTVPAAAPSGNWTFSVSCVTHKRTARGRTRIVLVNHGPGTGGLAGSGNGGGGKGGASQSCAPIASPPGSGQVCFGGDPFATYGSSPGEDIGQCTWYAAGMRPDLDGITTGNASEWLSEAKGKVPEGTVPVVGAIAVNTTADGGLGHVAYVAGITNGGATLILDEANLNNDEKVYLNIETPASELSGYIYGGPAGNGPSSQTAPPPPPPPPPPSPPKTYAQTSGPGPVHTWTDYHDGGGTEGPEIPDNSAVQVTCRSEGLPVEDGNPWWYELASSPYNNGYWASSDAFYNNGSTSGGLQGTPFFDPNVPVC
jgi:surface antigen